MNLRVEYFLILILLISCEMKTGDNSKPEELPIIGTWELISAMTVENGDTSITGYNDALKLIKIINDTHFSFLKHDLNKGKDSLAVFVAGGGTYTLSGNQYSEHLEFCNYREWEGHTFDFELKISGDTLIQQGVEKIEDIGVDRIITETYTKFKN